MKFLTIPDTIDVRQRYRFIMLRGLMIVVVIACMSLAIFGLLEPPTYVAIFYSIITVIAVLQIVGWHFARQERLLLASAMLIAPIWVALSYGCLITGGIKSPLVMIYIVPLLMIAVLLGGRLAFVSYAVTILYLLLLILIELLGFLPEVLERTLGFHLFIVLFTFSITIAILVYHLIKIREADAYNLRLRLEAERLAVYQQLTQDIAHDLRTPLSILMTKAYLIRKQYEKGRDINSNLAILEEYATKMSDMINDFFELTMLDNDGSQATLQWDEVDLRLILDDLLETYRDYAAEREITLNMSMDEDYQAMVRGDKFQLGRVFSNLLENAIHYGKHGGQVALTLKQADAEIMFSVQDDGIGIAPEHHKKIFERFYRVSEARTMTAKTGSGLGLTITQNIIRLHGGTIELDSALGQGSTFIVRLPLRGAQAALESARSPLDR